MSKKPVKALIIYYSLDGNTKSISETIAKELNADILELKLKNQMIPKGFARYFILGMQTVFKKSPELLAFEKDPENYDLVIIGTPVWASNHAHVFNTYFKKVIIKNKKAVVFCCCGGSSGKSLENLKNNLNQNEIIAEHTFYDPKHNKIDNEKQKQKILRFAEEIRRKS